MNEEQLILVDENDREIGHLGKMEVHTKGLLHRAFSIFIFNSKNELLLQQRASEKYHSPELWTNTCCSHPNSGETTDDAVNRRLMQEMGMVCQLTFKFSFIYKYEFENGLTEHELDHVYFGFSDTLPQINPEEVKDYRYVDLNTLKKDIQTSPSIYTPWLAICLDKVIEAFREKRN